MLVWEGGQPVPVAVERGSRGVRRGSAAAGPELEFGLGSGNGRACPDRAWVKMMVVVVVVVVVIVSGGGKTYSQDSSCGRPEIE